MKSIHRMSLFCPALLAGVIVTGLTAEPASAISAFARKYKVECSNCHSAMPYLNANGRAFKEAGYRLVDSHGNVDKTMDTTEKVSDSQALEKYFPIGGRFKGYVYNKVKNDDGQLRPAHEIEIFAAGSLWDTASFFLELEGEDEGDFVTGAVGSFGWHPSRQANIVMGYGSILHTDPYNSVSNHRRTTATHKAPLNYGNSQGARFRADAEFANFYGRVGSFFYEASYSAGNGNPEGDNPRDYLGRLAFDFTPDIMIGGLYYVATRDHTAGDLDITRTGFDFNLDLGNFFASGMYLTSKEEPPGLASQTNDSAFVELYFTTRRGERPLVVPLVRYDWTESNDGRDKTSVVTAQVNTYPIQNARLALEYSKEIDVPGTREKSDRIVLMADVNF